MKKLISALTSLLILSIGSSAMAKVDDTTVIIDTKDMQEISVEGNTYTYTVNEYDICVEMREQSTDELREDGYSQDFIDLARSDEIEHWLKELASYDVNVLKDDYGYSEEQISLLKNYDGTQIQDHPELRGVFADCTVDFTCNSASKTSVTVTTTWEWNRAPAIHHKNIRDIIGTGWTAINLDDQEIKLEVDQDFGQPCTIYYYTIKNKYVTYKVFDYKVEDPLGEVSSKFNTGSLPSQANIPSDDYAKKGAFTVRLKTNGNGKIGAVFFCSAYGHRTITGDATMSITPTLSGPKPSFAIKFGKQTEQMFKNMYKVTNSGKVTVYK